MKVEGSTVWSARESYSSSPLEEILPLLPESIACKLSKSGEQREKRRSGESEELKREKKVERGP